MLWLFLSLRFAVCRWIVLANLIVLPKPYVVKQSPNHIYISIDDLLLSPQISTRESGKAFEVGEGFVKVCIDTGQLLGGPIKSLNHLFPTIQSVQ